DIRTQRPAKKLDDRWYGPFAVNKVINRNAYRLTLPDSWKIHPVFHVWKLRRYVEDTIPGRPRHHRPPPAVVRDGVEEWTVDRLVDSRIFRGKLQFLVRWEGYSANEDTWEPEENVSPVSIRDF
ncbi:hypothetical protein PUNSTDRAFT_20523, partial [Punctularia strigosozonata HHB-11173 SS5]